MTDRPIIFSGAMVRALLDGRKTQTRRLATSPLAKTEPGDRLWVREAHGMPDAGRSAVRRLGLTQIAYKAEQGFTQPILKQYRYRPSIHMPRWASRLTLVVPEVRVERLNDISPEDCGDEGVEVHQHQNPTTGEWEPSDTYWLPYSDLWDSLHTKPGTTWDDNPAVVALTFTVHRGNIDRMIPTP